MNRANDPERTGRASMCKLDHKLMVAIAIYTRGPVPDQLAAPIEEDVHVRMVADRTLGGLAKDVLYMQTTPEMDPADQAVGFMVMEYMITYRTSIDDLGSP